MDTEHNVYEKNRPKVKRKRSSQKTFLISFIKKIQRISKHMQLENV